MKKALYILLLLNFCVVIAAKDSSLFFCLQQDSNHLLGWNSCAKDSANDTCCKKTKAKKTRNKTTIKCCQEFNLDYDLTANLYDENSSLSKKKCDSDNTLFYSQFNSMLPVARHLAFISSKNPPTRTLQNHQHTHKSLSIYIC
ncbi:MAG: hypothetical protein HRT88_12675 [Lentisphaeraceae bacterium]|nr:hypothetical protein [Lentisphaeraceae bacterium]